MGNNYIRESIFKTLAYADIFGFPLTRAEIWRFLISSNTFSKDAFTKELLHTPFIFQQKGFFCLKDKESCITKRIHAQAQSKRKYIIATNTSRMLSQIPTILLIGITGGLAMDNAMENDDIDLCILVKRDTLWITRLMVLLVLQFLGIRRRRNQRSVPDTICVNLIIDESGMTVSEEKQNLYTAHEVVQMKPIFIRDNTYSKFLLANEWVKKFLPNSLEMKKVRYEDRKENKKYFNSIISQFLTIFLLFLDWFAKKLQLWYMSKRGIIGVSDHALTFFPADYAKRVLSAYRKKVTQYANI